VCCAGAIKEKKDFIVIYFCFFWLLNTKSISLSEVKGGACPVLLPALYQRLDNNEIRNKKYIA